MQSVWRLFSQEGCKSAFKDATETTKQPDDRILSIILDLDCAVTIALTKARISRLAACGKLHDPREPEDDFKDTFEKETRTRTQVSDHRNRDTASAQPR